MANLNRQRASNLTKADARKMLRDHRKRLEGNLNKAVSQFQVRMCYIQAHEDLLDIAKRIVDESNAN